MAEVVVPLPKLTHLIFRGHRLHLEALVVGLVAPSLQHLDAELSGRDDAFPILHLCRFIRNSECQFTMIRLEFSDPKLNFYAGTSSASFDDQPFRIIIPEPVSLEQIGQELSASFSNVEELIIALDDSCHGGLLPTKGEQLRGFFYHIPRVKMMQVPAREAQIIARSFQQDGQEPNVDLLPALEQIKVDMRRLQQGPWRERSHDAFEPLIAARNQVERPIVLSWI